MNIIYNIIFIVLDLDTKAELTQLLIYVTWKNPELFMLLENESHETAID